MPTKYVDFWHLQAGIWIENSWMMSTKNLQFNCFPFPIFPLWRKAKFSCWKICALNSLWAFMALDRGSSPKKILFVGSCSSPRSFPKLLCRRESRFSCGNAEFLWNEKVEFPGWESFHQVKKPKKNQNEKLRRESWWKRERSSFCCLFSTAIFRSLKIISGNKGNISLCMCCLPGSCQLFLARIPDRASLSAAGSLGHFRSTFCAAPCF